MPKRWGDERMMHLPRQCAVLVGGLGTRLGPLTANAPKPLLNCAGRPFLAWVLRELCRFGIEDIILLAGYKSEHIEAFCADLAALLPKPVRIRVSVEPEPAGTGGAVRYAEALLDDSFLLINGDSWFDTNLVRYLAAAAHVQEPTLGGVLLCEVEDCERFGSVVLHGDRVTAFREKQQINGPGLINSGIYVLDKRVLDFISGVCSLERDVLSVLAERGLLFGYRADGYFVDIGIPSDYARAQIELPARLLRTAVFFDRDGVLNEDCGHVGSIDRFHWVEGAKDAVRRVNDSGRHAFVVTNQAGVAKGMYAEADVLELHRFMQGEMRAEGIFVDDIRYCPYHPEGSNAAYRMASNWRKPGPGMLLDLMEKWQIPRCGSLFVGDKETDMFAAEAAGVEGLLFEGGNLCLEIEKARPGILSPRASR